MKFKLESDKKLFYSKDNEWQEVELKSCFPLTDKNSFFSVLDKEAKEIELIESLSHLNVSDRFVVDEYLNFRGFNFEILGVYKIEEDFGLRHFEVKTQVGDKAFQTALDAWPMKTKSGEYIFSDIHGDQFIVNTLDFGEKYMKALI